MLELQIRTVPPKGPEDSPFVIVGEAPGPNEIKEGQPFVGPSGKIIHHALGLTPSDTYPEPFFINVIPHLIPKSREKEAGMLQEYVSKYRDALLEIIQKHPRKVILTLGNVAAWALTGDYNLKITQVRGKIFQSPYAEQGILATVHPAYLLRGNGSFWQFKLDVAHAVHLASGGQPHVFVPPTYSYLDSPDKVQELVEKIRAHQGLVATDIETSGFSHRLSKILMSGFSLDGKHVYVVPGHKREFIASGIPDYHSLLDPIWDTDPEKVKFVWHNGKFDIKFFRHQYQQQARVDHDTMLMSYSLNETRGMHDLETVASDWLNSPNWKGVLDSHKKKGESYDVIPEPILTKYMAFDIGNTYNLVEPMLKAVNSDKMTKKQYFITLLPASEYLAGIETVGMYVDQERVEQNRIEYQAKADEYSNAFNVEAINAGYGPINPNSPMQVSDFLYNTLKLPTKEKGTGVDILEKLPKHAAVDALLKYRKVNKGLSTYVKPVLDHIQDDDRVHQSYLLHGTVTGRLACKDPNLQNIPREPKLRGQFIPRPGYCFLEVDLNQAELRSLAALSGDEELCRIYIDPKSKGLHEEVRYEIYKNPDEWSEEQLKGFMNKWYTTELERVLEEQKMRAKNVNFGIVYGITAAGLSEQIEDTPLVALKMLQAWARKFPTAWAFIEQCRMAPIRGQTLVTVFGYKKRFGIVSPETMVAQQNEAANFPHQNTASTITMHGGIRIQKRFVKEYDTRICNTVHDSILFEVPLAKDVIEAVAADAIAVLEQVPIDFGITRVPFKADAKAGLRWGSLNKLSQFVAQNFAS